MHDDEDHALSHSGGRFEPDVLQVAVGARAQKP